MRDLDKLVDAVDVDDALDRVIDRHRRDTRRIRRQRAAVVAACATMGVLVGWLAVREPGAERSLDVAGQPEAPATPGTGTAPSRADEHATAPTPTAPTPPACAIDPQRIAAARSAVETSPLNATINRVSPRSIGDLLPEGYTVEVGTVVAARDHVAEPPPGSGWPTPAETGITFQYAGALLTVSTSGGDVEVPVTLAMGGSTVIDAMRPSLLTADLLALVGACVVVQIPTSDVGASAAGPGIVALAADPESAPLALDPWHDVVLAGYATPAELVRALLGGA